VSVFINCIRVCVVSQGKRDNAGGTGRINLPKTGELLNRLRRDRRGSAIAMMVAGLIPGIAALGSAIDAGRLYVVKSQLQTGVDAAALAGARAYELDDDTPAGRNAQALAYFRGNFPTGYMGTKGLSVTPTFAKITGRNTTTVAANVIVPMSFMRAFGFQQQEVTAVARAEIQPHPLEVMMVLDNTGSLKANLPRDANGVVKTRITALKDAAKSFFDVIYQEGSTRSDLAIGFVMYDITVNIGKLLPNWSSPTVVRQQFGFNDGYMNQYGGSWPTNHLGWKGCVFADDSVKDLNSTLTYQESGAWDIDRTLPGENGHPPLSPYFIPPMYVPQLPAGDANAIEKAQDSGNYYKVSNVEPNNNLFKLDANYADYMLNLDAYSNAFANNPYRRWFYQMYIGLNDGAASAGNDVITRTDGSYYDPGNAPWNFTTRTGTPFKVNYARIPRLTSDWHDATEYTVNPLGGTTDNGNQNKTEWPSPNWQCPEEAVPVAYGRDRSFYTNVIDTKNAAIYPANGTLHHAGLLWGYRLLVRDDVFRRTNPTRETPKRALVFMTDGETALGAAQNGYTDRTWTFYGNYADSPISASPGGLTAQSERRFSKTCAALHAERNPPTVYIVALTTTDANTLSMFEKCAPGHVYRTSDAATLTAAFNDIAAELVDLHLVQ
jgi:hypothetical protein